VLKTAERLAGQLSPPHQKQDKGKSDQRRESPEHESAKEKEKMDWLGRAPFPDRVPFHL
jgi:hypothetical protein